MYCKDFEKLGGAIIPMSGYVHITYLSEYNRYHTGLSVFLLVVRHIPWQTFHSMTFPQKTIL